MSFLHTLNGRLATFKKSNWPLESNRLSTPDTMAMAGFYSRPFTGSPDNASCFMCHKNLDGWESTDESWAEHVKHSPTCPLVRLDNESSRLSTFTVDTWPHYKNPCLSAEKMARAGFFYWPRLIPSKNSQDDTSVCFQCGLALDGWDKDDDPRHEHAKRRPECPFVKSGVAIRPCSFEFLLASKPDQNAVTHISARPQQKASDKQFQIPALKNPLKKVPTIRESRKASITPRITENSSANENVQVVIGKGPRRSNEEPVTVKDSRASLSAVEEKAGVIIGKGPRRSNEEPVTVKNSRTSLSAVEEKAGIKKNSRASLSVAKESTATVKNSRTSLSVTRGPIVKEPIAKNPRISLRGAEGEPATKNEPVATAIEKPQRQSLRPPTKTRRSTVTNTISDSTLLKGLESLVTRDDLDLSLESFLTRLVSSKMSQFDIRTKEYLAEFNSEAIKQL